jgi:hypothetical protein
MNYANDKIGKWIESYKDTHTLTIHIVPDFHLYSSIIKIISVNSKIKSTDKNY